MSRSLCALPALFVTALALAACANQPAQRTDGKLAASESACIAVPNAAKCKFQHDLAGGFPFRGRGGGD